MDLLAVDRERLPRAEMLGGGAVLVQALDVEILHVARDVRDAPRVVRGRAQQDAGRERERHAARLVSRSAEVHLDPCAGLDREQVRVVREQGLPGGGARPGHDPVVRTLALRAREVVEQTAAERARRDMWQVGRERGEERAHGIGSQPLADRRAEELLVPVAGEPPRQVHERRRPRAGIVGGDARGHVQQRVLDRGRRHLRDPRRASFAEPSVHRLRDVVPSGGERRARAVEADRPREPVVLERPVGEDLGQAAARGAEQQVDLEQAFARRDEPLREPEVVERRGGDVRHAPPVAKDLDRLGRDRAWSARRPRAGATRRRPRGAVRRSRSCVRKPTGRRVRRAPRACCRASSGAARRTRRRVPAARRASPVRPAGRRPGPARGRRARPSTAGARS